MSIGTSNSIIVASPDVILVTDGKMSERIKNFSLHVNNRPMFEERKWGRFGMDELINRVYSDVFIYESVSKLVHQKPQSSPRKRLSLNLEYTLEI